MTPRSRRPADPLHKGWLELRQYGVGVRLEVLEGVFSAAGVDAGTRHLLRWLAGGEAAAAGPVLDLGCGYGPLALWLAAADPERMVTAVDRDARALEATRAGAERNGLADRVKVRGSLGYDGVGGEAFDLIVSNIPAKAGPAALQHLLLDACHHLTPSGHVAVVVVARLAVDVGRLLDDRAVQVVAVHPSKGYTAFTYRFTAVPAGADPRPGFERGAYQRGSGQFSAGALTWSAEVSHDLAEFDTLSHGTQAALGVLDGTGPATGVTVVAGVGQGHLALALRAGGRGEHLRLIDRDLLALRTAAANLARQGGHAPALAHRGRLVADDLAGAGVVVVQLPEREPVAVTAAVLGAALADLDPATTVVVHGRTADVQRVTELLPRSGARLEVGDRRKVVGHTALRATCR